MKAQEHNEVIGRNVLPTIEAQAASKEDFTLPTNHGSITWGAERVGARNRLSMRFNVGDRRKVAFFNDHAERQVAEKIGIPHNYLQKMIAELPDLAVENVFRWASHAPQNVLVRTIGDSGRAFLSDRYQCIDNFDLAKAITPILRDRQLPIVDAALTESRLYLKIAFPHLSKVVPPPDGAHVRLEGRTVSGGIIISNSEVGAGKFNIEFYIHEHVCSNGLIVCSMLSKIHLGGRNGEEGEIQQYLRDDTKRKIDDAFWSKVRDVVDASTSEKVFNEQVESLSQARNDVVKRGVRLADIVERAADKIELSKGEREDMFRLFQEAGDFSRYGLVQAATEAAQAGGYDRRVELERKAITLLNLAPKTWSDWNTPGEN